MKIYIVVIILAFFSCKGNEANKDSALEFESTKDTIIAIEEEKIKSLEIDTIMEEPEEGFLFIDIGDIYYQGKELAILGKEQDTIAFFKGNNVYIEGNVYDIIEQEHLYKEKIAVKSYDPEYGLFILKCNGLDNNGSYKVLVNGSENFIKKSLSSEILDYKGYERYVIEGRPYLFRNKKTPLRMLPNEDAEIIEGYENFLYVPLEIKGDWLKVKDDKDCYVDEPSEKDIIGWVRWRKDGEIIIDIRHLC